MPGFFTMKTAIENQLTCKHCGQQCEDKIEFNNEVFCCNGCKSVYEILNEFDLCRYYDIEDYKGIKQKNLLDKNKFSFLDDADIQEKFIKYKNGNQVSIQLSLPDIHCSSCIWLLEKLQRIDSGIDESKVDFQRKIIHIKYNAEQTSLRKIVELLAGVGYEPIISADRLQEDVFKQARKARLIKLGIAGFCFSNIMLLSFPDYLAKTYNDPFLTSIPFEWISFVLALPVFFYSASEFYVPAYKGLKNGFLNIDAPVFLAVLITFLRSVFDIITDTSGGYFDSMAGIVFFMLLGRVFQDITYKHISFDKNLLSFIPLAITKIQQGQESYVAVNKLEKGDRIRLKNLETLPVDAILTSETALMDYSFVTGESNPQRFAKGEKIYAGGKLAGSSVELVVVNDINSGYLRSLWNESKNNKSYSDLYDQSYIHRISKYFTYILFALALGGFTYWMFFDAQKAINALTTVLIVACPCVLLLSHAYTYGFVSLYLNRAGIYLKNTYILDVLAKVNHIVFDKTGTITENNKKDVRWEGETLTDELRSLIFSLTKESNHYKSKIIQSFIDKAPQAEILFYNEHVGKGIEAVANGKHIKIGSAQFTGSEIHEANNTYVSIDGKIIGFFHFSSSIKPAFPKIINSLKEDYEFSIVSGDNSNDAELLKKNFPHETTLKFHAMPHDKTGFVESLQKDGKTVAMVGDGLNDNGALLGADAGIAIAGESSYFVPSCDVYIENDKYYLLPSLFKMARIGKRTVIFTFMLSLMYNSIGLYFSLSGTLTPGIAAVLMPISTLTIILTTFTVTYTSSRALRTVKNKS